MPKKYRYTHPILEGRPILIGDRLVSRTDEWGAEADPNGDMDVLEFAQKVGRFGDEAHTSRWTVKAVHWEYDDQWTILADDDEEYVIEGDAADDWADDDGYGILHRDEASSKAWWDHMAEPRNSNQSEPISVEKALGTANLGSRRPTCVLHSADDPTPATVKLGWRSKASGKLMHDADLCAEHHVTETQKPYKDDLIVLAQYGD